MSFNQCHKRFKVLVILCVIILSCFSIRVNAEKVSMVVLGDSLSAGYGLSESDAWVTLIQEQWASDYPHYELVNASISGETTSGGLRRLPTIITQHEPDWVFIELGGNDGLRGFQLAEMRSNLNAMIDLLQEKGIAVALSAVEIPPNFGPRYTAMFRDLFAEVAESQGIELIPFFMLEIALNPEWMQNDGIHPNLAAQPEIAKIMEPKLRALMEQTNK
ncbi:acyl-CoA thioesterase-1 [Idiomarinaceae bacterium HL-53]|nr:acyl-CoA thioesterase-1 [Idiomarinaceae bacterium HL-53]